MDDSNSATNPTGGAETRRRSRPPTLHMELMSWLLSRPNMQQAWKRVKANQGAPGIDGMRIEDFPAFAQQHWESIRQTLESGTYRPQPVRRVMIPKPDGGERALGIPTILDRVIQQAMAQVLTPIFDPFFSESSFGFRPRRSAHQALAQVQGYIGNGYGIAVDLDLAKFFDNVQHDVLMACIARRVSDKRFLALIGHYLRAGVSIEGIHQPTELGTPQGGPLSPLLANILLDELDHELEHRGHRFTRYADDLLIQVKSLRAGHRVKESITRFLTRELKLVVNEKKSRVTKINACVFLGYTFHGKKLRWSESAFEDFKHNVRQLTGRSWGVSMATRFRKLAEYVRGWMGYFGLSDYYRPVPEIDQWIRRRIRMCYWKQWRYARTKIRNLMALGTHKRQAILTAISSKSYWRLSKTMATQSGMTNAWLSSQGLISVRDLWMKAHGYS